ncbi:hypothetical protein [Halorubrum sp. CSM-61]|uniref:hypothetical protein n=1 Tax=Halorubrum sp. CSM-61 TaxID=2485838 RepID=UPI000F4B9011|nr:hypothetical protein [Halorubrum sp. CSM-61]
MSRGNSDQQSTAAEQCDGCDRGIDQVYLNAGTSFDVRLRSSVSSTLFPIDTQYHFCGDCGVEVATLIRDHFEADDETVITPAGACVSCTGPIIEPEIHFAFQPRGMDTWVTYRLCYSCAPRVRKFCEQIPEKDVRGERYTPPAPRDEPYTDKRESVFRRGKPYDQLAPEDRCILEVRQRATRDFPEQRLKILATVDKHDQRPEGSFEGPLSDMRVFCGNWIGIQPTNGVLELDYGTGTRQLQIRFDDAAAPDNRHRTFEGYVTHVASPSAEPDRRTSS